LSLYSLICHRDKVAAGLPQRIGAALDAALDKDPMDQSNPMTLTFRCPPELEPILPKPVPAVVGLPDWFKAMPQRAFNPSRNEEGFTVKKCPPFIDAMTYGFLMPLVCDLRVENGEFTWDHSVPGGAFTSLSHSPIDFHDPSQVAGSPFFEDDRYVIKFNNFWTITAPPGYSLLFTHPINRADLPFTTITGLVDNDVYSENLVNFPARWRDANFNGVLPKGTPVAQCVPVKREAWTLRTDMLSHDAQARLHAVASEISRDESVYRRQFRMPKN